MSYLVRRDEVRAHLGKLVLSHNRYMDAIANVVFVDDFARVYRV